MTVMNCIIMDVNWIIISNELDASNELDGSNELDVKGCKLDHYE
jgi:hypothetical protein